MMQMKVKVEVMRMRAKAYSRLRGGEGVSNTAQMMASISQDEEGYMLFFDEDNIVWLSKKVLEPLMEES